MKREVKYKRQIVTVIEDRVPKRKRETGKFYYEMRHTDTDWSLPVTIEKGVMINFWGTLVTNKPLKMGPYDQINLSTAVAYRFAGCKGW